RQRAGSSAFHARYSRRGPQGWTYPHLSSAAPPHQSSSWRNHYAYANNGPGGRMNAQDTLTLRKLDIFLAFMRLGNLARVAEEMELSTVSVHRALHALEYGVGCPLFRREGRNLQPLDTAYAFAGHARRSLDECRQGLDKVRDMAGVNAPRLRIGSLYSLTLHCIPQVIIGLKLCRPELRVDLSMDSSRGLIESLQNGRLDAAIMGANETLDHPRLLSLPMFEDA